MQDILPTNTYDLYEALWAPPLTEVEQYGGAMRLKYTTE